jgi:hypothetical protein
MILNGSIKMGWFLLGWCQSFYAQSNWHVKTGFRKDKTMAGVGVSIN